jgi:hypothetical protein
MQVQVNNLSGKLMMALVWSAVYIAEPYTFYVSLMNAESTDERELSHMLAKELGIYCFLLDVVNCDGTGIACIVQCIHATINLISSISRFNLCRLYWNNWYLWPQQMYTYWT